MPFNEEYTSIETQEGSNARAIRHNMNIRIHLHIISNYNNTKDIMSMSDRSYVESLYTHVLYVNYVLSTLYTMSPFLHCVLFPPGKMSLCTFTTD